MPYGPTRGVSVGGSYLRPQFPVFSRVFALDMRATCATGALTLYRSDSPLSKAQGGPQAHPHATPCGAGLSLGNELKGSQSVWVQGAPGGGLGALEKLLLYTAIYRGLRYIAVCAFTT